MTTTPAAEARLSSELPPSELPRARWAVALAAQPERARALADALAAQHPVQHRRVPQAGLALLTLADGVFGEAWNLGEIPLSTALVAVGPGGHAVLGGAQVMADDAPLATALAICDAVLAGRLADWPQVAALVADGHALLTERARARGGMLARTRADFAALDTDGTDDDETDEEEE